MYVCMYIHTYTYLGKIHAFITIFLLSCNSFELLSMQLQQFSFSQL